MLEEFFQKLGLTNNEQTDYIFILKHGYCIASVLAKRLNIKRVTAYAILGSLEKNGLVATFRKNDVTYFEAVSPKKLLQICNDMVAKSVELQNEAQEIMPLLEKTMQQQSVPIIYIKGKIKYYEGIEAVKNLIDETLTEGPKEQLCFGLNDYHIEHMADDWKKYTKKRITAGMKVRSIQPDTPSAKEYKKRDAEELRITRLVPNEKYPSHCELNIIGDMIALFTAYGEKPSGMKIYHKEMAQALRNLFELAWEKAEMYDNKINAG